MRHRIGIGGLTGLGNPNPVRLDNQGSVTLRIEEMFQDATRLFFSEWNGCDYTVTPDLVAMGIEPAYQYDKLKIVCIARDKNLSYFEHGKAFGGYGTKLVTKRKYYNTYKLKTTFVRFINKWHPIIYAREG